MDDDLGQRVKQILDERGFEVKYSPESGVYRPWHRIPVKVVYEEAKPRRLLPKVAYFVNDATNKNPKNFKEAIMGAFPNLNIRKLRPEIHIPVGDFYKRPEQMAASLIHEIAHADLMFFDCLASVGTTMGAFYAVAWKTDNFFWAGAAMIGGALAYNRVGQEVSAEIYGSIRHGFRKYHSLRRLTNPGREYWRTR